MPTNPVTSSRDVLAVVYTMIKQAEYYENIGEDKEDVDEFEYDAVQNSKTVFSKF